MADQPQNNKAPQTAKYYSHSWAFKIILFSIYDGRILISVFLIYFVSCNQSVDVHDGLPEDSVPIENLMEYNSIFDQRVINVSQNIKIEWDLTDSYILQTYYNVNKDSEISSADSITKVLLTYYKNNDSKPKIIELKDDGQHLDNEAKDGIYSNFIVGKFSDFNTTEIIIDVLLDSIGINYSVLNIPVKFVSLPPVILEPTDNSMQFSQNIELIWELDTSADGCYVLLLNNIPTLGEKLDGVLWEKSYKSNSKRLFVQNLALPLESNKMYTLLVYSFINTRIGGNETNRGSYACEWVTFRVK